jgi:hypothetical protein
LLQPVRQGMQVLGKARKRAHRFHILIRRHSHKNLRRPNVSIPRRSVSSQANSVPTYDASVSSSSPWTTSLMSWATSQGYEKWKSIKRDHHNTNCRCSSPMLWCPGLGSNSLTGSPKRNTNGCATYTYRCLPLLTTNPGHFWGPPP